MLRLRVKVTCETTEASSIAVSLKGLVDNVNPIKGGIIIDPYSPVANEYNIPSLIRNYTHMFIIDATECGGGGSVDNFAQVVTGMSGKALKPYFIPRKNIISNGNHAFFSIPEACIIIEARGVNVIIKEIRINDNKDINVTKLIVTEYHNGIVDNIPEEHIRFKQASNVAIDKSNCQQCVHTHYYVDINNITNKPLRIAEVV